MNTLDIIISLVLLLGAIRGFQKGFFHETATLAGLVAGVFIAILAAIIFSNIIENLFSWNTRLVQIAVFIIVFVIVVLLVRMFGLLLTNIFKALMLGFINRFAGFGIGLIKWGLILAVLFMVIDFFDHGQDLISEEMRSGSMLYPRLEWLFTLITRGMGFDVFLPTS